MSLNDLARATRILPAQISRIRSRGAQQISPKTMFAIADALEVDARWLFVGHGAREPKAPIAPPPGADEVEVTRLRARVAALEEALAQIESAARGAVRRSR